MFIRIYNKLVLYYFLELQSIATRVYYLIEVACFTFHTLRSKMNLANLILNLKLMYNSLASESKKLGLTDMHKLSLSS